MKTILFLILSFAMSAKAVQGQDGGGGHVVACYTDAAKTTLESVVLYDLWEQKELTPNLNYLKFNDFATSYLFISKQLGKIDDSSFLNAWYSRHFVTDAGRLFSEVANALEGNDSKNSIVRFIGENSRLKLIPDLENFIEPQDQRCAIQAMANYRPNGLLYVSRPLFEKLSPTDQAAFILHETVYAHRRSLGDTTSVFTRRLTAQVMAGTELINPDDGLAPYLEKKNNGLKCSDETGEFVFYAFRNSANPDFVQLQFERINRFEVLNKTTASLKLDSYFAQDFFTHVPSCDNCIHGDGFRLSNSWTNVDGLPETLYLQRIAIKGVVKWEVKPTMRSASFPFTCQTVWY